MADDKNKAPENSAPKKDGKPEGKPGKTAKKGKDNIKDRLVKWFIAKRNEYWAEFKRIVWPTREVLLKETITVITISLIFGVYIAILDGAFGVLFSQFAQFTSTLFS